MELDPRFYLETEARIISEDDTHAVIAVRVEKAFFVRNMALLAALADLMPQPRPAKPKKVAGAR